MSNKVFNIKKLSINPLEVFNSSGLIMGDDLNQTLKINSNRVNKNNLEFFTSTHIIFNYVRYVNNTQLLGVTNKKEYLKTAKNLLDELKECGFEIGSEWRDNNKLPYSKGNSKLSKDTVIINVSPASLCISSNNGFCEICDGCYALSSERRYINTLIYRLTQLVRFDEMSVDEIVSQFKNLRVFKFLRVNESGDVFNLDDVSKLREISKKLYDLKGVYTYIYTHRIDIWDDIKSLQTPYFKVNRSGIDFNPSPIIPNHHKSLFCDGECGECVYCKIDLYIPIISKYHGDLMCDDLRDDECVKRDLNLKREINLMFESGYDVDVMISHIKQTLQIKGDD